MKSSFYLISVLLMFFNCNTGLSNIKTDIGTSDQSNVSTVNALNIQCSPELYDLTTSWVNEYCKQNPSANITITKTSGNQIEESRNISILSDEYTGLINESSKWRMTVGHDAVVPVINAKNPLLNEIYRQGVSSKEFALLFNGTNNQSWTTLIDGGQSAPLHYYIYNNDAVVASITHFLNIDPLVITGIKMATSEEVISAVQKDIYAIGFCKLYDIRKANTNEWVENIKVLPIDKNANGRIDHFENIYNNPDALARGVWIGKYPNSLCGNIYVQNDTKPTDESTLAFLTWVLNDGGQLLNSNGYSDLASVEKNSNLSILSTNETAFTTSTNTQASYQWLIILAIFVMGGTILAFIVLTVAGKKSSEASSINLITTTLNQNTIAAPKGLYFDKTHTWTFMEKNGLVRVGIDDLLQHITGPLTQVKMKASGEMVRKGEKIMTIVQQGKQLNIYAPISGVIKEQNLALSENVSLINSSPYAEGWVYLIEPKNWLREVQFMYMGEKFEEWLKVEFIRLKDFFSTTVRSNTLMVEPILLQDGGELIDNPLANMSPEIWDDFQTKFIDISK